MKEARIYNGTIAIGDVVKMRNGGPAMCIKYLQENSAGVQWFDNKNHLHEKVVPLNSLVK